MSRQVVLIIARNKHHFNDFIRERQAAYPDYDFHYIWDEEGIHSWKNPWFARIGEWNATTTSYELVEHCLSHGLTEVVLE